MAPASRRSEPDSLDGGAIHVWRIELDDVPERPAALADEVERAERMRDPRRRDRFLASRIWLRVILGRYLDAQPDTVRFDTGERGKPSLVDGGGLAFSLSRSAGVGLVAVSRDRPVGVDVEQVRSNIDHMALAERFFAPGELGWLRDLPEGERLDSFFRLWARKEAVGKASGAGLAGGVAHLDVRSDDGPAPWSLASIDLGPGLAAAVATEARPDLPAARSLVTLRVTSSWQLG